MRIGSILEKSLLACENRLTSMRSIRQEISYRIERDQKQLKSVEEEIAKESEALKFLYQESNKI